MVVLLLRGQLLLLLRGLLLLLLLHHIHNRLEARVDGRLLLLLLRGEMVAEHSREVIIAPRTAARSTRARRRRTSRARTRSAGIVIIPARAVTFP